MRGTARWVLAAAALGLAMCGATAAVAGDRIDGPHRAYVAGPWGQIHVRIDGPARGPVVILMHKMVWSSVEFARAQPALARRGVRSVAIDLPGYGLSDAPGSEPSADQYADAILPVLKALGIRRPVLLGANTGATLVAAFALRHPDRARAIILDGPPVFPPEALPGLLAEPEFDRTARPGGAEFVARWHELDAMGKGALEPETIRTGLMQFFAAGPNYLWGHQAIFKYPLGEALGRVRRPVALLTYPGDQLRAQSLALKRQHPEFTLIETPFPRMMADFQDAETWANAVADYVLAAER